MELIERLRDLAGSIHPADRPTIYKAADELERLTAEHKQNELVWWDEKGALEDRISDLTAERDNLAQQLSKTSFNKKLEADNERLRAVYKAAKTYSKHRDSIRADLLDDALAREALQDKEPEESSDA